MCRSLVYWDLGNRANDILIIFQEVELVAGAPVKIKVRSVSSSSVMANRPRAAYAAKAWVCSDLFPIPNNPDRFMTARFLPYMTLLCDPLWNERSARPMRLVRRP